MRNNPEDKLEAPRSRNDRVGTDHRKVEHSTAILRAYATGEANAAAADADREFDAMLDDELLEWGERESFEHLADLLQAGSFEEAERFRDTIGWAPRDLRGVASGVVQSMIESGRYALAGMYMDRLGFSEEDRMSTAHDAALNVAERSGTEKAVLVLRAFGMPAAALDSKY